MAWSMSHGQTKISFISASGAVAFQMSHAACLFALDRRLAPPIQMCCETKCLMDLAALLQQALPEVRRLSSAQAEHQSSFYAAVPYWPVWTELEIVA